MQQRTAVGLVLVTLFAFSANRVESQGIGGLVKKKAGEVAKGTKNDQAKKEDAKGDVGGRHGVAAFTGCEVTPDAIDRFIKGLQKEIADRSAYDNSLKTLKTDAQYKKCQQDLMMTADFQKIALQGMDGNLTDAQAMAQMQKNGAQAEAAVRKACGENPSTAQRKLGDDLQAAAASWAKTAGMSDLCYGKLKEFAGRFCGLSATEQSTAVEKGIQVPGSGPVFWVFTADEAKAIQPRCTELKPMLKQTG